jgi:hypothetical protein
LHKLADRPHEADDLYEWYATTDFVPVEYGLHRGKHARRRNGNTEDSTDNSTSNLANNRGSTSSDEDGTDLDKADKKATGHYLDKGLLHFIYEILIISAVCKLMFYVPRLYDKNYLKNHWKFFLLQISLPVGLQIFLGGTLLGCCEDPLPVLEPNSRLTC